ncbi:MAG: SH3 domain-containing protein [Candidatus Sifarchaeia archaeon]
MKILKVIKNHKSDFQIPLVAKKGEIVVEQEQDNEWEGWLWCRNSTGAHGWVPKSYLESTEKSGQFQFLKDYNARELTIEEGKEVIVLDEERGWAWVRTPLGDEGWIPLEKLENLSDRPDSIPDLMK